MGTQTIIEGDRAVGPGNAFGPVEGDVVATPFTAISAATTSDAFHGIVFQGQILKEKCDSFGSVGWAYVPNLDQVLHEVHRKSIHHCVLMKGHYGAEVCRALAFRGITVTDCVTAVPTLQEIEKQLGPIPKGGRSVCGVHSH